MLANLHIISFVLFHTQMEKPMVVFSQGVKHGSNEGNEGSVRNIQKLLSRSS